MEWVWIIGGIIVIGLIVDNPWILLVIAAAIVLLVIALVCDKRKASGKGSEITTKESYIDQDFAREVVLFLNGYLSLCSVHRVTGHAYLSVGEADAYGINVNIGCRLFVIDGEHAVDALWGIPNVWGKQMLRSLHESYEAYKASKAEFEEHMKAYFGCTDLHYAYTDYEEYKYNDPDVVIEYERHFFTSHGNKLAPTLEVIKQEVLNKWPDARVRVNTGSIIVEK